MSKNQEILNRILKQQKEYLDGKAKFNTSKKEYERKEQEKFKGVSLVEFMHTPK